MPLPFVIKSKDQIPVGLESFYVEQGGEFVLEIEGNKLNEFRSHNVALRAKLEAQQAELAALKLRFDGIDPDAARTALVEVEKSQIKGGDVEKVVASRLAGAKAEFDKVSARAAAAEAKLAATLIDQGVLTLATQRGLRSSAVPDITQRARSAVRLVDGQPVVFEGEARRVGKDGVSPMSLAEWIETQVVDAPHLFETNAGGGAAGASPGGTGGGSKQTGKNPWLRESWNVTEQMRLVKTDPAMAARLKAAA